MNGERLLDGSETQVADQFFTETRWRFEMSGCQ
jgi:hypothetical protein